VCTSLAPNSSPKIARRPRSAVVVRERIVRRLDGASAPVVWIWRSSRVGQDHAGFELRRRTPVPSIWYQLDAADNDPASFLHFLGVGARRPPFKPRRLRPCRRRPPPTSCIRKGSTFVRVRGPASLDGPGPGQLPGSRKRGLDTLVQGAFSEVPDGARVIVGESSRAPASLARLVANQRNRGGRMAASSSSRERSRIASPEPPRTSTRMRWPRSTPSRRLGCRTGLDRRAPAPIPVRVPHRTQ